MTSDMLRLEDGARAGEIGRGVHPREGFGQGATAMRIPASSARSCSSFSRLSRGEGRQRHERASAARR